MFEFVDDLTSDELDAWIVSMGASVEYLGDGAWAVMLPVASCEGGGASGVDKAGVIRENSAVERVG